jgi:hypothetical protein
VPKKGTRALVAIVVAWALAMTPAVGPANNHHDHIYAVPDAVDFRPEFEALRPLRGLLYYPFFSRNDGTFQVENARLFFSVVTDGQAQARDIDNALDRITPTTSLGDVLQDLFPGQKIESRHFEMLLRFPDSERARRLSPRERRSVYISLEGVRRELFLKLVTADDVEGTAVASRIFGNFFARERLRNRGILHLSVPNDWFPRQWNERSGRFRQPNGLPFLLALHEQAEAAQSKLLLFMSVARASVVGNADLPRALRQLEDVRAYEEWTGRRVLGGLDIAGSIVERDTADGTSAEVQRVVERFHQVFATCARLKIPLRIHAFEGANRGLFYQSLWFAIREYEGEPLTVRIGHTNRLDKYWLGDPEASEGTAERLGGLRANKRIAILLETNPVSNHVPQGANPRDLVQTLQLARRTGHTLLPGADGGGFLRGASYVDTVRWLETNRVPFDFDTLHPLGIDCGELLRGVGGAP